MNEENDIRYNRTYHLERGEEELTAAAVVPPDELMPGRYYMILGSDIVNVYMTQMGPAADYQRSGEAVSHVPLLMLAYCFPFCTMLICAGEQRGKRQVLDARQHRLAEVSKRFVASLFPVNNPSRAKIFRSSHGEGSEYRTSTEVIKHRAARRARPSIDHLDI